MASTSSLVHFNSSDSGERGLETIEIDPQYAQGLGLASGDVVRCKIMFRPTRGSYISKVEIGLLYDLPLAQSVAAEPLSSDDWDILVRIAMLVPLDMPLKSIRCRKYMRLTSNQHYSHRCALLRLAKRSMFGFWAGQESVSELVCH